MTARPWLSSFVTALLLGAVLAHYLWSASSSGNPFRFGPAADYYNELADGFLAGRLSLPRAPDPKLLGLEDPYDPVANRELRLPYRTQDLSLYRGRFYLYWGVAPVLVLFLPFRVLTGVFLPANLALALFLFGGVLFSTLALRLLLRRFHPTAPPWLTWAAVVFFGSCNYAPFLLRRPTVYELAPAAGYCLSAAGVFFLLAGSLTEGRRLPALVAGSLCIGLAIASRPTHLTAGVFLVMSYALAVRRAGWRGSWRAAVALAAPVGACGLGLLAYNQARFGSPAEFGARYLLTEWKMTEERQFSLGYLPLNAYLHVLLQPYVTPEFPFFQLGPLEPLATPPQYRVVETTVGLLPASPLALLALFWPLRLARPRFPAAGWAGLGLVAGGVAAWILICCYGAATLRYGLDWVPPLLVSAALAMAELDALLAPRRLLCRAVRLLAAVLLAYSMTFHAAIGLTGYYRWLERANPRTYEALENAVTPLQRLILTLFRTRYGEATMKLRFSAGPTPGAWETLAAAGGAYRHDVLCIRTLDDAHVELKFNHRGAPILESGPVAVEPGGVHELRLAMGSLFPVNGRVLARLYPDQQAVAMANRVQVSVDGVERLSGIHEFIPSPPSLVAFGRDTRPNDHCDAPFSGEIVELRRELPRPRR